VEIYRLDSEALADSRPLSFLSLLIRYLSSLIVIELRESWIELGFTLSSRRHVDVMQKARRSDDRRAF
jgi:hypothetical protein